MVVKKKSADQVDQVDQVVDPMVVMLVDKIRAADPSVEIGYISIEDISKNVTVDRLLELLAIAANNKKQREQLITEISKLTTSKKILASLPGLPLSRLQEILENLQDPTLLKIKRAVVNKDDINYTDYQSSKTLDVMLYIQGQKTDEQVDGDSVDAAIGSVFVRVGNLQPQYFCEVFKCGVVLSDNAYQLGLSPKQIKSISSEIALLWCYESKVKKMTTKQTNDKKKQQDRELMRQNMIAAIRDRK